MGPRRRPRRHIQERLRTLAGKALAAGRTIIEFGSGDGRNLLDLKRTFPEARVIGFELSPASVALTRAASQKFGIAIEVHVTNCAEPITELQSIGDVALVFSMHALEQMPRIYVGAVRNMLATNAAIIAMFEPAVELYPWSARGVASRFRARAIDRLRGLAGFAEQIDREGCWRLITCRATGFCENP